VTAAHRAAWLLVKGVPWLVRRGRDLGPVIPQGLLSEYSGRWGQAAGRSGMGAAGAVGEATASRASIRQS
jgi:hypothetical protein